jgi:hypothetical protein
MEWMTPLNFFQRQSDVFGTWQVGTGEWLLEDPSLKDWESGSGEILWCHGMRADVSIWLHLALHSSFIVAGAGKTVLSCVLREPLSIWAPAYTVE